MTMTDPIADMLMRMRNAIMASYDTVDMPVSKMKINIAKVMRAEGYIRNYKIMSEGGQKIIRIFLKYDSKGEPAIIGMKRVSKPSCRVYAKKAKIPKILKGLGINILSTSKGIMADRQATKEGVGGEILCAVW